MTPKSEARFVGVVFSAIIAIRAGMKRQRETFSSIFRGITSAQSLVKVSNRTEKPERAALRTIKVLMLNRPISSPAGSINKVDDRFPKLITSAFSISDAPISLRYNGNRGCTNWVVKPMATFSAKRVSKP
jgi:hypothetical protein